MDVIVRIKNATPISRFWAGQLIAPSTYYTVQSVTEQSRFANNNDVLRSIATAELVINDGTKDLTDINTAINHIKSIKQLTVDGKEYVLSTPRKRGTITYWTGASDDITAGPTKTGGSVPENKKLKGHHLVGQPTTQAVYLDLNTIANETYIYEGYVQWLGAYNDEVTLELVPKVTPVNPSSGTNYRLQGGYLIVPAAGDGNISIDPGAHVLVQIPLNEFGQPSGNGFWNATFNPGTGLFENIQPAPAGNGAFSMFAVEVTLDRFINKLNLLGSNVMNLRSSDSAMIGHNFRIRATYTTIGADHEWWWNASIVFHRKRTT